MTNYCKSFASAVINDMMKSLPGQTHSSSPPTEARLGQLDQGCCCNYTVKRSVQVDFGEASADEWTPPRRRSGVTPPCVHGLGAVAKANAVTPWSHILNSRCSFAA